MSESTRRWQDAIADQPVDEERTRLYERLIDAQQRIAHPRYRTGVSNEAVRAALDTADEKLSEAELRDDLYLSALGYYVEALGGRLEVRAVFSDEEIVVRRYPK